MIGTLVLFIPIKNIISPLPDHYHELILVPSNHDGLEIGGDGPITNPENNIVSLLTTIPQYSAALLIYNS